MRSTLMTMTLLTLAAAPVAAQQETGGVAGMTCGDFLALGPDEMMTAMLDLRAEASGGTITEAEEVEDATVVTGATEAGATGGSDGGPDSMPHVAATPEARQRVAGMRTACEGVPEIAAIDALIAAHADYDPIIEEEQVTE